MPNSGVGWPHVGQQEWGEPTQETIPCIRFLRPRHFGPSKQMPESNIASPITWGRTFFTGDSSSDMNTPCCPAQPPIKIACGSLFRTALPVHWEGNYAGSSRRSIARKDRLAKTLADVVPPPLVARRTRLRSLDGCVGGDLVSAGSLP